MKGALEVDALHRSKRIPIQWLGKEGAAASHSGGTGRPWQAVLSNGACQPAPLPMQSARSNSPKNSANVRVRVRE